MTHDYWLVRSNSKLQPTPDSHEDRMRIGIVTPAPPRSQHGNRATAVRWRTILRQLGHRVTICQDYAGENFDLLVALHARKSAAAVARFHQHHADRPLLVALTGTDLYIDVPRGNKLALRSLDQATRLIALQPLAAEALPKNHRDKMRVIYQSVPSPAPLKNTKSATRSHAPATFDIFVVGHLRSVKDPFRAAMAVRNLPESSQAIVHHYGLALTDSIRRRAEQESQRNDRYRWCGEISHAKLMQTMNKAGRDGRAVLVHSSKVEGGPHAISEAVVAGLPVLATDIAGSTGLLGVDYPGLFPVGDTRALRDLIVRAETDGPFYKKLHVRCQKAAKLFEPAREVKAWRSLLRELA